MKKIIVLFLIFFNIALVSFGAKKPVQKEEFNFDFFKNFNDEILIENIARAIGNNLDLKIALSKVKESERIVKMSLANELPTIDFEPLISKTFSSGELRRGANNYMIKSYNQSRFLMPVYVNYEVDIFAKNRLKTKSKQESLKMVEQDKKMTYILLASSLGVEYFNLIRTDELLKYENELLALNKELENLAVNKEKHGLLSEYDVLNAKERTINNQNRINELNNRKEILVNQIGYLMGDKLFSDVKRAKYNTLTYNLKTPDSFNSNIILNRPDVISATENVKRAQYDARVAKRELLPSFNVYGTFGFNGYANFKGITKNHTGIAEIGVNPTFNVFDGGKKWQMIKLKKQELERANYEYEKAVIAALQEINDTLAVLKTSDKNYSLSKDILAIQNTKLKLKENNKNDGLASNVDYIFYKQNEIIALINALNNDIDRIIASINLYRALGGYDYAKENL